MEKRVPTELDIDRYEQLVSAFSWSFQQDVVSFLRMLHEKGIDLNWAIACIMTRTKMVIVNRKERREARLEWERKARKCPKCKRTMYIAKVNDHPSRMVGGGYKTQWICPGNVYPEMPLDGKERCDFEELSKRSPTQWMKKLRINAERMIKMRHPYLREARFDFVQSLEKDVMEDSENGNES